MRSLPCAVTASLLLAACGGGNSTGPSGVIIAGSYASTVTVSVSNTFQQQQGLRGARSH